MADLRQELEKSDIPYRIDDKGYLRYSDDYSDEVDDIVQEIDKGRKTEVGTSFKDPKATKYFRTLLEERGIEYRTETHEGHDWTYWRPESDKQEHELEMMVVNKVLGNSEEKE